MEKHIFAIDTKRCATKILRDATPRAARGQEGLDDFLKSRRGRKDTADLGPDHARLPAGRSDACQARDLPVWNSSHRARALVRANRCGTINYGRASG